MRRERRRSWDGSFDGRSESSWDAEKGRRSNMVVRDGMMGWSFGGGGSGGRRRSDNRRRDSWIGEERVRMRFTTDD